MRLCIGVKLRKMTMIFKVDFKKVYDSACYDFLDGILERIGFGVRWKRWIHGCLKSFIGFILDNGIPTVEF